MVGLRIGSQDRLFLYRSAALAVAVRVGLLLVAYIAGRVLLNSEAPLFDMLRDVLTRWDAPHYLRIAEVGYRSTGEDRFFLVFFPLYPLTVRLAHYVVQDYVFAGLVVSFVASIAAGYFLQALASLDADDDEAARSLLYFTIFPTAYFLVLPYTEALFLALSVGSFYYARRGKWAWCGVFGALACATRLHGLVLIPALVVEAYQREGRSIGRATWLGLVPLGFVAYLYINQIVLGDAFGFMDIQKEHWFHQSIFPWESLQEAFRGISDTPPSGQRVTTYEAYLVNLLAAAAVLVSAVRWLRPSYQVYGWLSLLFLMSVTWQISLPRYLIAIFPLFFILARYAERPVIHQAIVAVFALTLGGLFTLYAVGQWAF